MNDAHVQKWEKPAALTVVLISIIAFAVIAILVASGASRPADDAILHAAAQIHQPAVTTAMKVITTLGSPEAVLIASVLAAVWLAAKRRLPQAVVLAAGVVGSIALNSVLKHLFLRTRPDQALHLVAESGLSFPSNHAMATGALAAAVLYLSWHSHLRYQIAVAAFLYVLLVGLSRVYLGVHYPTDIVGGWLASFAWAGLIVLLPKKRPEPARD